jgi:iron(II)-dependent oxidoreductase
MALSIATSPRISTLLEALTEARARTLRLVAPVTDHDLVLQHDELMSPIIWDLGHIAHFEELWLTRNLDGEIRFVEMPGMYNPFEYPRRTRSQLEYPDRQACIAMMADIRERALASIAALDLDADHPLTRDGLVVHLVLQHEYQHGETILQTLQLKQGERYRAPRGWDVPTAATPIPAGAMVRFEGGEVTIGSDDVAHTYDNERPRHRLTVPAFRIDVAPVRNAEYLEFMNDRGYARRELWSDAGWTWQSEASVDAPRHWQRTADGWTERYMDRTRPVDPLRPVCHVCYHEAEAFARWAGKRLPTEIEWEVAASWDGTIGRAMRFPWGDEPATPEHANIEQLAFDTAPVGAYPRNISPVGCHGMIGDVWEWTSSDFAGHPGFRAFPYPEYSEAFFGSEYKVLRGGSWATRAGAIRNTFRNWDYPIRRQIFSGFRCAADA